MNRVHALFVLGCALAGCAGLPSPFGDIEESRQVVELVGYTQKVAQLDPAQQRRAFDSSSRLFASDPGAYARVRLALLLALPGTAFNDDARAVGLLDPLAAKTDTGPGPLRQLAGLLHAQIGERLRERRRAAQLKGQLDALKSIERTIMDRQLGRQR